MTKERIIKISPTTRLEGEGNITLILDENGNVKNAYFQMLDFRGFEKFLVGRQVEEVPRIVPNVCGVCSWAHHMAAAKAVDVVFGRNPTPTARNVRELSYCVHTIHSHMIHFFLFASPDFLLSPDADPSIRNFIGLLQKHPDLVKDVLKWHTEAERIQEQIAGKAIHPSFAIPGGVSKGIKPEEADGIGEKTKGILNFTVGALSFFRKNVLENEKYKPLFFGDMYRQETYYMGLVDGKDQMNFYDGMLRVVNQDGREEVKFKCSDYLDHIAERVEPWTYGKFPYLKQVGWNGLRDGKDSGVFRVNSLPRLNVTEGMPTPRAQEAYEEFIEALGKPAHATLGFHWARLIEVIYCAERVLELLNDPETFSRDLVNFDGDYNGTGVGVVEAPRGTLIHHYETDEDGIVTNCNLVVPTTMNNAAICNEIRNSSSRLIKNGEVSNGILNRVEMAFRAYDPCISCATHSLPGEMPLTVEVVTEEGELVRKLRRT